MVTAGKLDAEKQSSVSPRVSSHRHQVWSSPRRRRHQAFCPATGGWQRGGLGGTSLKMLCPRPLASSEGTLTWSRPQAPEVGAEDGPREPLDVQSGLRRGPRCRLPGPSTEQCTGLPARRPSCGRQDGIRSAQGGVQSWPRARPRRGGSCPRAARSLRAWQIPSFSHWSVQAKVSTCPRSHLQLGSQTGFGMSPGGQHSGPAPSFPNSLRFHFLLHLQMT